MLCDGKPGLTRAQTAVFKAIEGGDITVRCLFHISRRWKTFCKKNSNKREDILIRSSANRQKNGRYSIEYEKYSSYPDAMYVSITNVSSSDSGTYKCVLGSQEKAKDEYIDFRIEVVSAAASSKPACTLRPTVTSEFHDVITPQTVPYPESFSPFENKPQVPTTLSGVLLYVGLSLTAVVVISVTLVVLYWKKKMKQAKERPEMQIPEANRLYEDILDESRPGPVEMCTASVSASFRKTTETSEIYNLASAPREQEQTEDSEVTYSELEFTNSSSAPQSQSEAVIYAVPRVQTEDASVPLYSTVTLPSH